MSDAFAQINALLAAAAAQQQKQQSQQQQNQSNQQSQFGNQFNNIPGNNTASALMNNPNLLGQLNEQSMQALLYNQSMQQQQKPGQSNQHQQRQQNNNLLPNQPSFGQMPLLPSETDQFRNENSFFNNQSDNMPFNSNHPNNNNMYNQNQRQSQNQQNEPPTRFLEPYFSDNDSPFNSLEQIESSGNMNRDGATSNQSDILDQFQKISLNESMNRNQKMNNQNNHNNSHHNTSSNFDSSMFSLNDSDIYNADQNYMPGTASLIEDVDKQIMVVLRDGRTLIGYLRSIDQYANLLLSSTFERIHVGNKYGDIPKGIYIIRGENVVLIGEVDFKLPAKVEMIKVDIKEILELQKEEQKSQENEKNEKKALLERCAIPNTDAVLDEYY